MKYIEKCKNSDVIMSCYQGTVWQKIESSFDGKIVFPLLLYSDDFEVNNPLSPHRGVAQLCGVYFSLLCIPPEYRSTLDNIFVAQIHRTVDHKKFGNTRIFANVIKQLKFLETDGIFIMINERETKVYFALLTVAGDNLGLNGVLGYVTSFNSNYCCRFCTADIPGIATNTTVVKSELRKKEEYEEHVTNSSYGITANCVFNELQSYHQQQLYQYNC